MAGERGQPHLPGSTQEGSIYTPEVTQRRAGKVTKITDNLATRSLNHLNSATASYWSSSPLERYGYA